jgi:hypothetical protein
MVYVRGLQGELLTKEKCTVDHRRSSTVKKVSHVTDSSQITSKVTYNIFLESDV